MYIAASKLLQFYFLLNVHERNEVSKAFLVSRKLWFAINKTFTGMSKYNRQLIFPEVQAVDTASKHLFLSKPDNCHSKQITLATLCNFVFWRKTFWAGIGKTKKLHEYTCHWIPRSKIHVIVEAKATHQF